MTFKSNTKTRLKRLEAEYLDLQDQHDDLKERVADLENQGSIVVPPTPIPDPVIPGPTRPPSSRWGMNLSPNNDYTAHDMFADLSMRFRSPWGSVREPWKGGPESSMYGYPVTDFGTVMQNVKPGRYRLQINGSAIVNARLNGHMQGNTLVVVSRGPVHMTFKEPKIKGMTLYREGARSIFDADFINQCRKFACLRYMDLTRTNHSKEQHWGDRVMPIARPQPRLSWSIVRTMADKIDRPAWICVPHLADEDYIEGLAAVWENFPHRVYVEYSNEVWNSNFEQFADFRNVVGPKLKLISKIMPFAKVVLAGQYANPWHVEQAIKGGAVFDAIAIAPYFSPSPKPTTHRYSSMGQMFDSIDWDKRRKGIAKHKAIADDHGVPLLAYEAGQHFVSGKTDISLIEGAQMDFRMKAAYSTFAKMWADEGGDLCCWYNMTHKSSKGGHWGHYDFPNQPNVKGEVVEELL